MVPVGKNGIIYFSSYALRQCNGVNSAVGAYVNGSRSGTDNLFQELNVFPFTKSNSYWRYNRYAIGLLVSNDVPTLHGSEDSALFAL
jgi:hypothetical protein